MEMPSTPARHRFASSTLPALLWGAVIFGSSSIPSARLPHIAVWNADKLAHFGIYCILAFLIDRALRAQTRFPLLQSRHLLFTVLLTTLYGLSDEIHQVFVPGRNASVYDLLADAAGALLFCAVSVLRSRRTAS
jgi:VanZ family protein